MKRWLIAGLSAAIALSAMLPTIAAEAPREYDLKLSEQAVGVIETVLTKYAMPWEIVNPILQAISQQVRDQQAKAATPAPAAPTPEHPSWAAPGLPN